MTGAKPELARRLGPFDATMIVMGGIIGSGIFINPYVVARQVHSPALILGAWLAGGVIALLGAFVYAELASLRPEVGGQYAYLRDALHPGVAFLYGWALLLVIQSGGMAAVAITFARYFLELSGAAAADWLIAALALAILTIINCLGVRSGATTQNTLMVLKIGAIAILVLTGLFFARGARVNSDEVSSPFDFAGALTPVMFAYGGWQTASFISGELRRPRRDLVIGLICGVAGVALLYVAVNVACIAALGTGGLAMTSTPASAVMEKAFGTTGGRVIAAGIAISTLGFLSQGILTAPRVYLAMADDRLFFRQVGWIHPTTRVPVVAIGLQAIVAIVIAISGRYEQILNYVVSVDFVFFGLTGVSLFILRRKTQMGDAFRSPGHPITTILFVAACWAVALTTIVRHPLNSAAGLLILAAGVPAYLVLRRTNSLR